MYARSTTITADPQRVDDGIAYVRDEVLPALQEMTGCIGVSMLVDRETGRCIVAAAWDDEQALHGSAERVKPMRERAAEIFGGKPEVAHWEIAVLHRLRPAGAGACVRATWTQAPPDQVERMLDAFKLSLLPRLEGLPGFCSVSLLVDRSSGRGVSAVTYESREAMEQARQQGAAMRDHFARSMQAEILEVSEFELVLAHLRVPETV